jgi:hypothetical protein
MAGGEAETAKRSRSRWPRQPAAGLIRVVRTVLQRSVAGGVSRRRQAAGGGRAGQR